MRHLLVRAAALYILLRLLLTIVGAVAANAHASAPDHPLGVVLLTTVLGLIDIRRRGERMLWANLGVGSVTVIALFAVTAAIGEGLVALWSR